MRNKGNIAMLCRTSEAENKCLQCKTSLWTNQIDRQDTGLIAVASNGRRHSGANIKRQSFRIQTQHIFLGCQANVKVDAGSTRIQ